ncbi:ABC transporter ATP-binding protein [Streptomyces hainanensis]|uniref:ABC transporter ATP-binding protein n=1 Tax=Streptomyces hainanensis TaxID=402648 RepID=A0A4R4TV49_9ACTN|nr:ABC transporter ATP-binding protein [Streptomyces hainanensis]TDC79462.1 ABC transporter ATP-binding protein [Streptomyces hainanensis]
MIQAIGLTSASRRGRSPAVEDLSFEARPGHVTVLLGPPGSGKSATLRLMLQLSPGRGVALFRGRPIARVPHPSREIGALLGDVPGHPRRTAAGHLRMLGAAAGVPAERADEALEGVGLGGLAGQRLGTLSRGMDRRLGLAAALLGDPHTLVLDEPSLGLAARETAWLHGLLRERAERGGAVLLTTRDVAEAVGVADRVVTLDTGRLVADQTGADFARTRLRPRVAVRTPHAERLAAALTGESRAAAGVEGERRVEIVRESGNRLSVYGSSCAAVGEVAFRHRVLVHQLADEEGDSGDRSPAGPLLRADGRSPAGAAPADAARPATPRPRSSVLPPELPVLPPPGPSWPLRYELRRWSGVPTGWWVKAAALFGGLVAALCLAAAGALPAERVLAGWAEPLPLPPVAMAAGLLGALSFGHEFRYPALTPSRVPVPRRLSLLAGKLVVTALAAVALCVAALVINSAALTALFDDGRRISGSWDVALSGTVGLSVGCAWAGLLAAGIFRSTLVGSAAVGAVPLLLAPALRAALDRGAGRSLDGLPGRLHALTTLPLPSGVDRWLSASAALATRPVGWALLLSLAVLICGYTLVCLRNSPR